jgi:anti-sigma factor RsiW
MDRCPFEDGKGAELVLAYCARTLTPDQSAAFELHMSSCAGCRELAAAQQAVWSALDTWTPEPISSNFDEKLYQRILTEEQIPWWQRLFRANWSLRPAVPVAAACGVLIAAFFLRSPQPTPVTPASSQPKVRIEQVERALDDIDMLKQLGFESSSQAHSREKI